MKCELQFTVPSDTPGFVEYKRGFVVEGKIVSDLPVPDNALMTINLLNENNEIVRHISCDRKNKPFVLYYPNLTAYDEELDPGRVKMQEFGFPALMVEDIERPEESIHNACIKLWYCDDTFRGIFVSASDVEHGAIFDDGLNFYDENNKPYSTLPLGKYTIEATLSFNDIKITSTKEMVIAYRDVQFICRFNPASHKEKMVEWCRERNISVIKDVLPGYLEPYLGKWFYHMGILSMYRANDICLYDKADIIMFVYLIDKTSTSYETELAHLQATRQLDNKGRMKFYHYDIGEAVIGKDRIYERQAQTPMFKDDEYMYLCRIDKVNNKAKENTYYIDERAVDDVIFDLNNIEVNAGDNLALMGVLKPWQLDPNDFTLLDTNVYQIDNGPDIIRYTLDVDGVINVYDRKVNMERIDKESIGGSVYEFYNIFHINRNLSGKQIKVKVECIDMKGNKTPAYSNLNISVR